MPEWKLFAVLPNLLLERSWDFETVCIVHHNDDRLIKIKHESPAVKALLDNFKDQFSSKKYPSALIASDDLASSNLWEKITDIRNAFAISCICNGWKNQIGNLNIACTLYSDYFDFYPYMPQTDKVGLYSEGFGLSSGHQDAKKFSGQTYPDLAIWSLIKPTPDEKLLSLIVEVWKKKYSQKQKTWRKTALFRSLAVAYRASRLPKGCDNMLYDLGIQLSLWISAHECLVHKGKNNKTGYRDVIDVLKKKRWSDKILKRKSIILRKGKNGKNYKLFLNYVQKLYLRLYDSRNAFLHGNRVSFNNVFLNKRSKRSLFIEAAPLIYQSALEAMFQKPIINKYKKNKLKKFLDKCSDQATRSIKLEDALLKIKNKAPIS